MADDQVLVGYKISQLPVLGTVTENEWVEIIQPVAGGGYANYRVQLSALAGLDGAQGPQGPQGPEGPQGPRGEDGANGVDGKSAFEIAVDNGFEGTEQEWLESLVGRSAFEVAVELGYEGTVEEWLTSLRGADGQSAYDVAVENGFEGDEAEWLDSLKGADGKSAYEGAVEYGYEGTEEEFYARMASGQAVNGGVFITNVVPLAGGNVGDKVYDEDETSLRSASSTGDVVVVHVLALPGNSRYRPRVTVNGEPVMLSASADKPLFTGTVEITLDETGVLVAQHEDGAQWTTTIERDLPPVIQTAVITSGYPGSQTEVKENDIVSLRVTTDVAVNYYEILNDGALKAQSNSISPSTDFVIPSALVANRGNTPQSLPVHLRVRKANGTWSEVFVTNSQGSEDGVHTLVLNNLRPTLSWGTIGYPAGQGALKGNEAATVPNTAANFDEILYESPNGQLTILDDADTYAPVLNVARLSGAYNINTANLRATLRRLANGAESVFTTIVRLADAAPVINITTPAARLRSGGNQGTQPQNHVITITSNQELAQAPSLNAPEGTWQGNWTPNAARTVWTRQLRVHDDDAKGEFTWNSLSAVGLSGVEQTEINSGATYRIGGFVFRTLTVAAFPVREVAIGTEVVDTSKLRCSNLSKGASGSQNFTYQNSLANATDRFTITGPTGVLNANGDLWYNCDGANASSNTSGTMQIELEEVV